MPRPPLVALVALVCLLLTLASHAQGQGDPVAITVQASPACPASSYCLDVVDGNLSAVAPGDRVEVTFQNQDSAVHDLHVALATHAHTSRTDTPGSAAIAGTKAIGPGQQATLSFSMPEDGQDLYLWCDVGGHESLGMWYDTRIGGGPEALSTPSQPTPLPFVLAIGALAGAGLTGPRPRS